MTGNIARGKQLFDKQSKTIDPMSGIVIWVWDKTDLLDLLAYVEFTYEPSGDRSEFDLLYSLDSQSHLWELIKVSAHGAAPIYFAWIPFVATTSLGDPILLKMSKMAEMIAESVLHTCTVSGYNPNDGFVMYRTMVGDVLFSLGQILSATYGGRLVFSNPACQYLQQHVPPNTLTELHRMSVTQITSMVRSEQMKTEHGEVIWPNDGRNDWTATSYFQ